MLENNLYYIDIDKDLIPYRFDITLGGSVYFMEVRHNQEADILTVDLFDDEEEALVLGEPMVYGERLFGDFQDVRFPINELVPLDLSGVENRVSLSNIGRTVFLYDLSETDTPEGGVNV